MIYEVVYKVSGDSYTRRDRIEADAVDIVDGCLIFTDKTGKFRGFARDVWNSFAKVR